MSMEANKVQSKWCRECGLPNSIGSATCAHCNVDLYARARREPVVIREEARPAFADFEEEESAVRAIQGTQWDFWRFTAAVASWLSIIVVGSIFLFLVCIVIAAFMHMHIG